MEHDTLPEVIETARLRLRPWELTAMADVDNTASQRVMEKLGMRKEPGERAVECGAHCLNHPPGASFPCYALAFLPTFDPRLPARNR